jgi:spermidine/putrescine transport system ATP-binding protein
MNERSDQFAIEVKGVSKIFSGSDGEVRAVDDVSLAIRQNEFLTLLGPSGCGKTTLLRLLAGFEHPTAGEIWLNGKEISALPPFRRPVNTVFQSYALFPHMTVAQNIGFGLKMRGADSGTIDRRTKEMLQLVQMESLRNRRTDQISGGQQQRVALARALAPEPEVLLLDEPLSALDYKLRKEMQIELKRLQNETGITFVFVTHDQEEALTMSDRIAVMNDGQVLQLGAPREIYDHPAVRFVADFIGDSNFIKAELVAAKAQQATVRLSSGVEIESDLPDGFPAEGAVGRQVTLVVRPEHARLSASGEASDLLGTLKNVVYFGTDTHFHVALKDGSDFVARLQNARDAVEEIEVGSEMGIRFAPKATQILRD